MRVRGRRASPSELRRNHLPRFFIELGQPQGFPALHLTGLGRIHFFAYSAIFPASVAAASVALAFLSKRISFNESGAP